MKKGMKFKRNVVDVESHRRGLCEGVTLRKGGEVLEYRERRGSVLVRSGRSSCAVKLTRRAAAMQIAERFRAGWKACAVWESAGA